MSDNLIKYFTACAQPQSNYALDHFVDGGQYTPERKFRQVVIELESSKDNKYELEYQIAKNNIKIDKLIDLSGQLLLSGSTPDSELVELKIERVGRRIESLEKGLIGIDREIRKHLANLEALEKELGFTSDTTEQEVYDRIQKAEADHYILKLASDTAARLISNNGGPAVGVLSALTNMPDEDATKFKTALAGMVEVMKGAAIGVERKDLEDVLAIGESVSD